MLERLPACNDDQVGTLPGVDYAKHYLLNRDLDGPGRKVGIAFWTCEIARAQTDKDGRAPYKWAFPLNGEKDLLYEEEEVRHGRSFRLEFRRM